MSKVIIAENAGFCFGVKRAIDKAYENVDKKDIYTYGSLIHNKEVMKDLDDRGITKIDDILQFKQIKNATVIIRSHGISKKEQEFLTNLGHKIIDTTCPYVKKIHRLVNKHSIQGKKIIIFGDKNHPEVKGIIGWCESEPIVIDDTDKLESIAFDKSDEYVAVSQTTFNMDKFCRIVEKIKNNCYNIKVLDTICSATEERQLATKELAKISDAMIVVGDIKSSNTQKLYDISSCDCKETYFVQTASDMDYNKLKGKQLVGITAGASTPKKIIEEVRERCQKILNNC